MTFNTDRISLNDDYEGEVVATLISSKINKGNQKSVLYIHGFIDYFFHPHLAEQFNKHSFDFYAIDLRKYGRSLLPHQHPNYCRNLNEYFEELTIAIKKIREQSNSLFLLGHSTGGLIATQYLNKGEAKELIDGLILNSPFFDFNQPKVLTIVSTYLIKLIAKISPYSNISQAVAPAYVQSLHSDFHGEWDFNLNWKPIEGHPTYYKWLSAIIDVQNQLKYSNITVPILIMHSSSSKKIKEFSNEAFINDIILNVEDMKKIGKNIGKNVSFIEINNAQHDIFLSSKDVRTNAFKKMFDWFSVLQSRTYY